MSRHDFPLAPRSPVGLEPRLIDRAEERMLAPARRRGYELRLLGATVLPQRQEIVKSASGKWLFVDQAADPTAEPYGGKIPIPAKQHALLTELNEVDVRPDLVWLAHELAATWGEGDAVPVPTPAHLREKDQRLAQRLKVATRLFLKGAGATLGLAAALPLVPLAAGAGLDPVVLGGVRLPEAPVVAWAVLAQWEWE